MPTKAPKTIAGNPQPAMAGVERLHPVQRRRGVVNLAHAAVKLALAPPNAAEVKAHDGKAQALIHLVHGIGDAVIHGPAMQRVGVQYQGQRRTALFGVVVTAL